MCERLTSDLFEEPPSNQTHTLGRRSLLAAFASLGLIGCTPPRIRRCCAPAMPVEVIPPRPAPMATPWIVPPSYSASAPTNAVIVEPPMPTPTYEFVTRAEWGAESLKDNYDPMGKITRLTLHHTDTLESAIDKSDREFVKAVQNLHRNKRDWADIGYHYLIGRDGRVYEGRKLDAQGAHAGAGKNGENLGISVIGNFEETLPEEAQLRTLRLFLGEQIAKYSLEIDALFGHRDLKATECPGDALYAWYGEQKEPLTSQVG